MKKFQLLQLSQEPIQHLLAHGVNPRDVQHLPLYQHYLLLRQQGEKMIWIINVLAHTYHLSPRAIYAIIARLGKDCK